jgi:predicted nuclease of predicted toxin-antitoxin system
MKFVADESVDQPIVTHLRAQGHVVFAIVEQEPSLSDKAVLDIANQQEAVLITGDKDFGELVFRDQQYSYGILLIRLAGLDAKVKAEIVNSVINEHNEQLINAFTVISPKNIRIRPRFF